MATVMECMKGFIGITASACVPGIPPVEGQEEPLTSGLFITDLPGISLQSIELIANPEQKGFLGVWKTVETRALLRLRTAALNEINKCFLICDIEIVDCLVCENKQLFAMPLWYLLGAELCYERLYSDAISRYTTINKAQAADLRSDFLADFEAELKNAVKGIDIKDSDCIDDEPEHYGGSVNYQETNDLC